MSAIHKQVVRKFYQLIWNRRDKNVIPSVLHADFSLRSSLGDEVKGHQQFIEYLDTIHSALDNYECRIEQIVSEEEQVFAKVRFGGFHRSELLGYSATDKEVSWQGAALFSFHQGKVIDLWVLGDLKALEAQLMP